MSDLFVFLSDLMTSHAALFQALGLHLFRGFAVILLAWFGIKSALASASGHAGFQLDRFASLVLTIAFGYAMITYYANPIPVIGISFYRLITDQGANLAKQIELATIQDVKQRLDSMYLSLESPTMIFASALEILHFVILVLGIALAADGMAVLELAQSAVPIRLLPGHCKRLRVRDGQHAESLRRLPSAAVRFGRYGPALSAACVPAVCVHLRRSEDPLAGELHFQRALGRKRDPEILGATADDHS
jgi:hypothetical protein